MTRRTADRLRNVKTLAFAAAVCGLSVGCQVPGGSFGYEPMQTRFAEMTRSAVAADEARPAAPYVAPVRPAPQTIALAAHGQMN